MNRYSSPITTSDEIDLADLFQHILRQKKYIIWVTLIFSMSSILYSLYLPNLYKAEVLLAPNENKGSSLSSAMSSISSLTSLAGFSLPDGESAAKSKEAIAVMQSHSFFKNNFLPNIFLPDLMAYKKWVPMQNINLYDEEIYNSIEDKWIRDESFPFQVIPSSQESFEIFKEHFSISEDFDTRFVRASVIHQSPFIAKSWLDIIVKEINRQLRQNEKEVASKSIAYIQSQLAQTNFAEVKVALSELAQNQTQKLMLIEAREDYVYKVLEPPYIPELKFSPKRALICILGSFLGILIGVFITLINYFFGQRFPKEHAA